MFILALCPAALPAAAEGEAASDSLLIVHELPVVLVTTQGESKSPGAAAGAGSELDTRDLRERAGASIADVGPLLPSVRPSVNSRGESLFMLRGASERHLRVSRDGVPLNLAWDERTDLALLPVEILSGLEARRGVWSLAAGPGALAGSIELRTRRAPGEGSETLIDLGGGELGARRLALLHGHRLGAWGLLAAAALEERDGWLLPDAYIAEYNQSPVRRRVGSDLERRSFFVALDRPVGHGGDLSLSLALGDAAKGVPPESHRPDARFWRYPDSSRRLLAAVLDLPLAGDAWRLEAGLAADLARQEIRVFDDASYQTPALLDSVKHESDQDLALHGRLLLRGRPLPRLGLLLALHLRDGRHRESLIYAGPEENYRQRLSAETLELDLHLPAAWTLRGGLSWVQSVSPASGPHPAREGDSALDWLLALRRPGAGGELRIGLSRRARFPGLRELYSGALGQFLSNPDLAPEHQDLFELGYELSTRRLGLELSLFAAHLAGGIEKQRLEDGRFRRVNAEALSSLGLETELALQLGRGLSLGGHALLLRARRQEAGNYNGAVEDRPDHQGALFLDWAWRGCRIGLEGRWTGPRQSADATDADDGLRLLPTQGLLGLRAAWHHYLGEGRLRDLELRLRLDNLGNAVMESQTGLPEAGRSLSLGCRLGLNI
jgi:iron complex outermembrane recepter protein